MRLVFVAICIYMIWGYSALAMETTSTQVTAQKKKMTRPEQKKQFSIGIELEGASNLKDTSDSDYEASRSATFMPVYQFTPSLMMGGRFGIEKELNGFQDSSLINTEIKLSMKAFEFEGGQQIDTTAVGVLPTNEADRVDKTFRGASAIAIGLKLPFAIASKSGSFQYTLSGLKNYHEFDRTNLDEPNLSYRFRHILTLEQDLLGPISLEISGFYQAGYSYQNAMLTTFKINEKLSAAINKSFALYVSHTNNGDALKADGIDSNIHAYDSMSSSFAAGLAANF